MSTIKDIIDGAKTVVDISDIIIQTGDDEIDRHVLDSADKIVRWIKYKFDEQSKMTISNLDLHSIVYQYIDLSNCILSTFSHDGSLSMTNLYDIVNTDTIIPDCFVFNGYGPGYTMEVKKEIICTNSIIYSAFFHQSKFHERVNFNKTKFLGNASFGSSLFEKNAYFQKSIFSGNFDFSSCIFKGDFILSEAVINTFQVHFENSIFKDQFKAQKITFNNYDKEKDLGIYENSYISFYSAEFFGEVDLSNNNFSLPCFFENTKVLSRINFQNVNFSRGCFFNNSEIAGNILLSVTENILDDQKVNIISSLSFKNVNLSARVDIELCKIDNLNGQFMKIGEDGLFRIYESQIKSIDLTAMTNQGIIFFEDNQEHIVELSFKSLINKGIIEVENTVIKMLGGRKTARILKDSATKSGNKIDALYYKAKEMKLYNRELNENKARFNLFDFITITIPTWESVLLKLNTLSNNNGLSWIRGVCFTMFTAFAFYVLINYFGAEQQLFIFDWRFTNYGEVWKGYLKVLNILNISGKIEDVNLTAIGETLLLLSKIFISYGIYQTISAFRKYGK